MLKKTLAALIAVAGNAAALPALASNAVTCEPPQIHVSNLSKDESQYKVACHAPEFLGVKPQIHFTGELKPGVKAPFQIHARYTVDVRDDHARKLDQHPREDQALKGQMTTSTDSVAALGIQFARQTKWDPAGVLSVQEDDNKWRVFSLQGKATSDRSDGNTSKLIELGAVDAGVADTAFSNGRATVTVDLGERVSRYAEKSVEDKPTLLAVLGLRQGKLELLEGATRVTNHDDLQNALLRLDRQPADITRAWGVAARAQIMGLEDTVRYAEQKVAAHHPNQLEEFQENVRRLQPFAIPARHSK